MLFACVTLAIALLSLSLQRAHPNELDQMFLTLLSRCCLVASLVVAPWSFKLLILAVVFLYPRCLQGNPQGQSRCPRHCIARSTCLHPQD